MKKEGDSIKPGDILAQIETDKATVDFEMQEEGFIAKLLFPEGAKNVKLGTVVAIVVDSKEDVAKFKDFSGDAPKTVAPAAPKKEAAAPEQAKVAAQAQAAPQKTATPSGSRVFVSPLAKRIASEGGLDLSGISGSGPSGRIIKSDVESALQAASQAPKKVVGAPQIILPSFEGLNFEDKQNSQIRKIIADRLSYSKQNIPHYYVTVAVSVDNLIKLRARLNNVSKTKISVNDMVIKAASMASVKVPETNASWMGDFIRRFKNINMSVAI